MKLDEYVDLYKSKTAYSRDLHNQATQIFPGGVSHNIRFFNPYPFYTKKAKGKYLYDFDGNRYLDFWNGHWALVLGHSPKIVTKPLKKQIKKGTLFGTTNKLSLDLGELITKGIPKAEHIRFSTTGSEATMYAIRLARAVTGKRVIAKVVGGWHGFNTNLLQSVNYPYEVDEGMGIIEDESRFIESIQFNDLDRSLKVLDSIKDDLAGIIVEPILGGAGCITPNEGYLEGLQEFAKKNGGLMILDEIVTGFRFFFGGLMTKLKLDPDIFTLGKIIGGGLPIGAVCGKKEIMRIVDTTTGNNKTSGCYIGGGTFSSNPLTMTSGYYTLKYLNKNPKIYEKINFLGDYARSELSKLLNDLKIPSQVTGSGSLFMIHFLNEKVRKIENALDAALADRQFLNYYNLALLSKYNIFFLPQKMGAFSFANEKNDVNYLVKCTEEILEMSRKTKGRDK